MKQCQIFVILMSLAGTAITISPALAESSAGKNKEIKQALAEDQQAAWERLRSMAGVWKGKGEPGSSKVEVTYELILQDKFLHARTESTSKKETHVDWEIFSFDSVRKKVILRQFVSEGYVNRFALESISKDGHTLVFDSEACEGAPPGFRARNTLTFKGDNNLSQQLELAPPGQQLSGCASNTLTRHR